MSEIKFTLRLADGRWVSSPTNTVTANPNLAGVLTAADDDSAAELRSAMERLHDPLELVPWQRKRTNALTRHSDNVALRRRDRRRPSVVANSRPMSDTPPLCRRDRHAARSWMPRPSARP